MRRLVTLLVVIVVVAGGVWGYLAVQSRGNVPKYRLARVERGPLTAAVSATGNLNAVITVQVGSQVSGQIKQLLVDFNSVVKKGQVIARIDPEIFEAQVNQAKADVEAGHAAAANENSLAAMIRSSLAQLRVQEAGLASARAQVANKQANLKQAQINLDHSVIFAPVDGVVVSRQVDVGQTVAASLQAPVLFTIAQDLTQMQVETSVDEADIGRIKLEDRATFTVDAFPGETFTGTVTQIRKAAQVVQNVVTYTVVVAVANPSGELVPGMTANVQLATAG